jgi:SAM-dependent methyltransferase
MNKCKWCNADVIVGKGPNAKPEWRRWHCSRCGCFGYFHDPNSLELAEVYKAAWADSAQKGSYAAGSTDELIAYSLLKAIKFLPVNSSCLDYGGGKGFFAKVLAENNCKHVSVYEPFGKNPGLTSVNWVNDLSALNGKKFDWIFMIEVIEHFLNPRDELQKVRDFLAPNGNIFITTPNALGWRGRIEKFNWREVQNPTHINLFTAKTLKKCLINAGYTNPKQIFHPVSYGYSGVNAFLLALTQIVGIDGGLRFIATNSGVTR